MSLASIRNANFPGISTLDILVTLMTSAVRDAFTVKNTTPSPALNPTFEKIENPSSGRIIPNTCMYRQQYS
jgi:hypothetical protein